jgi:hypothetical protein
LTFSTCTLVQEVAYVPGANETDISNDVTDESITRDDAAHVNETSTLTTEANLKQISLQQKPVLAYDSTEGTMPLFNVIFPIPEDRSTRVVYTCNVVHFVSSIWPFTTWVVPVFLLEYCIITLRICCLLFKFVF